MYNKTENPHPASRPPNLTLHHAHPSSPCITPTQPQPASRPPILTLHHAHPTSHCITPTHPHPASRPPNLTLHHAHPSSPCITPTHPHTASRPPNLNLHHAHPSSPCITPTQPHTASRPPILTPHHAHPFSPCITPTHPHPASRPPNLTLHHVHPPSPCHPLHAPTYYLSKSTWVESPSVGTTFVLYPNITSFSDTMYCTDLANVLQRTSQKRCVSLNTTNPIFTNGLSQCFIFWISPLSFLGTSIIFVFLYTLRISYRGLGRIYVPIRSNFCLVSALSDVKCMTIVMTI